MAAAGGGRAGRGSRGAAGGGCGEGRGRGAGGAAAARRQLRAPRRLRALQDTERSGRATPGAPVRAGGRKPKGAHRDSAAGARRR